MRDDMKQAKLASISEMTVGCREVWTAGTAAENSVANDNADSRRTCPWVPPYSGLRLLAAISILCQTVMGQACFRLVSELARTNLSASQWAVQGWRAYDVSYFPGTEVYTNFTSARSAGEVANLNVDLGTSLPPGSYRLWLGLATQGTNIMCSVSAGDSGVNNLEYSGNKWKWVATVQSSVAVSNVLLQVTKLCPIGSGQNYWFAGVWLTPTNWGTVEDDMNVARFADYTPITEQATDVARGNLLPNASFEFGMNAGGWSTGRSGDVGYETWLRNMTTNEAWHGQKATLIAPAYGGVQYALYSPPVYMRGDRKQRLYTLSFYHRGVGSKNPSLVVDWGAVHSGASGFWTNAWGGGTNRAYVYPSRSGWGRFSTSFWFTPMPDRLFYFRVSNAATTPGYETVLDGFQLEEGALTEFALADPVECNLTLNRNGNMFNVGEPRNISVELYNSTLSRTNVVFRYEVFDWMNRMVAAGVQDFTAPAGYSTQNLTLITTNNGLTRMYGWLDSAPSFRSELCFSVVPLSAPPTLETNSYFGTHACQDRKFMESNYVWGISWQRGLSPGGIVQWKTIEPTEGNFTWASTDAQVNACTNVAILFANLSDHGDMPAWGMTNGVPRLNVWSNFVYQTVNHYKERIHYWEDINEPAGWWAPAVYASILEVTAAAVKAADPGAYFVAFGGGAEGANITWLEAVWDLLSVGCKNNIDAISVHIYSDYETYADALAPLIDYTGKPLWQTESGAYNWGDYKGDRCGGYQTDVPYAAHWLEYEYRRMVWRRPSDAARTWLRCLGRGFSRFFYYDGRLAGYDWRQEVKHPSWFNFDDSLNSIGIAFLWSKSFCDQPKRISCPTNTTGVGTQCLAFVLDRSEMCTLVAWSKDFNNYAATVTNSAFAVFDLHGNLLQTNKATVPIGRIPTYWVSRDMTADQLYDIFKNAVITPQADAHPPNVSIDVTAYGVPSARQLPLRFRWTAADDSHFNSDDAPADVQTRYRFYGLTDWSAWSALRYTELTSIPASRTHLEVQAKDADGNVSEVFYGPDFVVTPPTVRSVGVAP